jgi:hypothetical protein
MARTVSSLFASTPRVDPTSYPVGIGGCFPVRKVAGD